MIIPSVLTDSLKEAQRQLDVFAGLEPKPEVVQIDIIDGYFADNLTIGASDIRDLNTHDMSLDVQLMTVEPADFLEELVGTPGIRSVIAQVERLSDQRTFVSLVRDQGWQAGLALDLYTPLEAIEDSVWKDLAIVQVMGNTAGLQGQSLHPAAMPVIEAAQSWRQQKKLSYRIMVDIGIRPDTVRSVQAVGADDCVTGSYLLENSQSHWKELREAEA